MTIENAKEVETVRETRSITLHALLKYETLTPEALDVLRTDTRSSVDPAWFKYPQDSISFGNRSVFIAGFGEFECLEVPRSFVTVKSDVELEATGIGVGYQDDVELWHISFHI